MDAPDLADLERFTRLIAPRLHERLSPAEIVVAFYAIDRVMTHVEIAAVAYVAPDTITHQLASVRRKLRLVRAPGAPSLLKIVAWYHREVGIEVGLDLARTRIRVQTHHMDVEPETRGWAAG